MEEEKIILPDNAFRELKEGEKYEPVMSPQRTYAEVNGWSVTWGVLMAMLFSAAAASGRRVRILHQLTQPEDHPSNIYHPEGEYLKGLVLYVE